MKNILEYIKDRSSKVFAVKVSGEMSVEVELEQEKDQKDEEKNPGKELNAE